MRRLPQTVQPLNRSPRTLRLALAIFAIGLFTLFGVPASAAPPVVDGALASAPGDPLCSLEEWQKRPLDVCIGRLHDVPAERLQCLTAPNPSAPDSGFAGWFAGKPTWEPKGPQGRYARYGYAGYDYTTYDIGCAPTLMHPDYKLENTIANGEFMFATGIVAASNGLREKAWDPGQLWNWTDPLVEGATKAIYEKVFSVFGVVTLAVIGMYLLWRSRQAQMSSALTTAAWALLVLVAVTALARWPIESSKLADGALIGTLSVVHDAVGPPTQAAAEDCKKIDPSPGACDDHRPPAVRAGDTAVESLLYRNWLRGVLGSADSETAKKYGAALYRAKSFSWEEMERIKDEPALREGIIRAKQSDWMKVAEQIRAEDPEAYEYLQGKKGMERIGAGFVAILSAICFAAFDLVASLLVLLGFLIIRWAVVAAPALATVGLLRPASAGLRRLVNAVLSAVINVAIFGIAASVYLFAVDLIMSTTSLPGWLQVTLVLLCGVVGWLLLRPYRRFGQLAGGTGAREIITTRTKTVDEHHRTEDSRRELAEDLRRSSTVPEGRRELAVEDTPQARRSETVRDVDAASRRNEGWRSPDVPQPAPNYSVYRPTTAPVPQQPSAPSRAATRAEAKADLR